MQAGTESLERLLRRGSLCLAPLAGYSDAPYRLLCFEYGADFTVTEMVSADGLVRCGTKTHDIMKRMNGEGPVGVQLFGSDPEVIARAAVLAAGTEPAFIDLNFGCPVKKVVRRNGGVALMRDLDLMGRICGAVKSAVSIPVTAKIRSGWYAGDDAYLEAGRILEECGMAAVTLHPRYRTQGFSGEADWRHIRGLRERISIPIIANGDVNSVADYREIVEITGCDTVMIGRGAFGRPWIFRDIKRMLAGDDPMPVEPEERFDCLGRHLRLEVGWKGERRGVLEMRKHYRWYLKGLPDIKEYRVRLAESECLGEVEKILARCREDVKKVWKKPA